jgi:hypothetical protein
MAKFRKGSSVSYTGEDKTLRNKVFKVQEIKTSKSFIGKDSIVYGLSTGNSEKVTVQINENLLKNYKKEDSKKTILDIDKRAKQIRKESGITKVERVTFYNMSLKEAKKQAFQELKK